MEFLYGSAHHNSSKRAVFLALNLVGLMIGCEDLAYQEPGEELICRQTYEFGNFGCTRIEGRVLGARGQPIGASIYPVCPDVACETPIPGTDADGRFALTLHRFSGPPSQSTADVILYARSGTAAGALVQDSLRVTVPFGPIGTVAPRTWVEFRLPIE